MQLDASTVIALIAAIAAAFTTVRKAQFDSLKEHVESLETRVETLEADLDRERKALAEERSAHSAALLRLRESLAEPRQCATCPQRHTTQGA